MTVQITSPALLLVLPCTSPSCSLCFPYHPAISLSVSSVSARGYHYADSSLSLPLPTYCALRVSTSLSLSPSIVLSCCAVCVGTANIPPAASLSLSLSLSLRAVYAVDCERLLLSSRALLLSPMRGVPCVLVIASLLPRARLSRSLASSPGTLPAWLDPSALSLSTGLSPSRGCALSFARSLSPVARLAPSRPGWCACVSACVRLSGATSSSHRCR